jgi:hypothetical protein
MSSFSYLKINRSRRCSIAKLYGSITSDGIVAGTQSYFGPSASSKAWMKPMVRALSGSCTGMNGHGCPPVQPRRAQVALKLGAAAADCWALAVELLPRQASHAAPQATR